MKSGIEGLIILMISGIIISGCSPKERYERMLNHELASGVRKDSLFMAVNCSAFNDNLLDYQVKGKIINVIPLAQTKKPEE